jgi:hypothetical protein
VHFRSECRGDPADIASPPECASRVTVFLETPLKEMLGQAASLPIAETSGISGDCRDSAGFQPMTGQRSSQLNYVPNRGINNLA